MVKKQPQLINKNCFFRILGHLWIGQTILTNLGSSWPFQSESEEMSTPATHNFDTPSTPSAPNTPSAPSNS